MFEDDGQVKRIKELAEGIVLTEDTIGRMEKEVIAKKEALITLMQQAGQMAVKLDSGLFPRLETKQRIGKRKEVAADDLHIWLARHGLADIIRPTVHHGTLQTTLEGFIAAGNPLPEKIFNQYEQVVIRFNGRTNFLTQQMQKTQGNGTTNDHEKTRNI